MSDIKAWSQEVVPAFCRSQRARVTAVHVRLCFFRHTVSRPPRSY
jgi:hypothetical protein